MKVLYKAFEQCLFFEEWGYYMTYGIQCCAAASGEQLDVIQDISTDRELVEQLAERCTRGQLSPVHFWDVVMDAVEESIFYWPANVKDKQVVCKVVAAAAALAAGV